ncbi:hypothetical protein O181_017794 [Austropuccinia psidii MF-1]|uniref:Uncharacterized protein n=1 Tax=Austropuccinia psidii MF-1 TaxID=1389203 RepID=A0A9Q3C421_9BASI|nr:hypothetical protein [Austropuccinia psidii MF-1]
MRISSGGENCHIPQTIIVHFIKFSDTSRPMGDERCGFTCPWIAQAGNLAGGRSCFREISLDQGPNFSGIPPMFTCKIRPISEYTTPYLEHHTTR